MNQRLKNALYKIVTAIGLGIALWLFLTIIGILR